MQTVHWGRLQAVSDQQRESFQNRDILRRFWSKDLSLWPPDPSQQSLIRSNLAWLELPERLEPLLLEISRVADDCIRDGLTDWVFLALGSSSLAARALLPLIEVPDPRRFMVLDSSHPSSILHLASKIDLPKASFILANKAGDRLEDLALFLYFQQLLSSAMNSKVSQHFAAVTENNSFLAGISYGSRFRASFIDPPNLRSSFCSLLHFGALLTGLFLIEPKGAMSGVRAMRQLCEANSTLNPALQMAVFFSSAAAASCRYLVFLSSPSLAAYSNRLGHLISGSLARDGCGLIPVCGDVPQTTERYQDHAAFVFLTLASEREVELEEKLEAFRSSGVSCIQIQIPDVAALLPETFKWEIAVALACANLGFNPFDWPDIRHPRQIAMDLLEKISGEARALDRTPRLQESGIQLFAEGRTRSEISNLNLLESMRSFFRLNEADGFVVCFVFLERTPEVEKALRGIRGMLMSRLGVPVVVHYGPRCFDQYAYLCRSGIPRALHIVLTADYPVNIPVPGASYTFAQLHLALILGEFESMIQTDHPVIRLNLTGRLDESLTNLERLLAHALPRTT